jgi:hypothetical protein
MSTYTPETLPSELNCPWSHNLQAQETLSPARVIALPNLRVSVDSYTLPASGHLSLTRDDIHEVSGQNRKGSKG